MDEELKKELQIIENKLYDLESNIKRINFALIGFMFLAGSIKADSFNKEICYILSALFFTPILFSFLRDIIDRIFTLGKTKKI